MMENDKGTIAARQAGRSGGPVAGHLPRSRGALPATTSVMTIVDGKIAYDAGTLAEFCRSASFEAYDVAPPDMRRIVLASAFVLALVAARQRAVLHPAPPPPVLDGPTFSNEVVRIFQNRCQSCHHPGDIAPFSLMTYADAAPHADAIKFMTQTRQMPPWKADAGLRRLRATRAC